MTDLSMSAFGEDELTTAEVEAAERLWGGLTDDVRRLLDLTIRSRVDDAAVGRARALLAQACDVLAEDVSPGPAGVRYNAEGRSWNWGNTVVGVRNAMAPPVRLQWHDDGTVGSTVELGAPYEGPPGCVHGGVSALLLDHLMGETASDRHTRVTVTGTLTLRYERPLPLGRVAMRAWISGEEGRKVTVSALIGPAEGDDAEPVPAVRATGVFITPRWALDGGGPTGVGSLD